MAQRISFETYRGNAAENYERYFVPTIGAPFAADLERASSRSASAQRERLWASTSIRACWPSHEPPLPA